MVSVFWTPVSLHLNHLSNHPGFMRRLLLRVLIMCLLMVVLLSTSARLGQLQPLPERLAMLHLLECAPPCWIGIVPGRTTLAQAKALIEEVFAGDAGYTVQVVSTQNVVEKLLDVTILSKTQPITERVFLRTKVFTDNAPIQEVEFNFAYPDGYHYALGDLVNFFGGPQHVALVQYGDFDYRVLLYSQRGGPHQGIGFVVESASYLDPLMPLRQLFYFSSDQYLLAIFKQPQPWRGFTTLANYGIGSP
jgi:hypothetical protein